MLNFTFHGPAGDELGLSRRTVLKVGSLGLAGLSLPELLRARAQADPANQAGTDDTAVILVWMAGGPSQLETYDMKPDAPAVIGGEFKPISTNLPDLQICEHLPYQSQVMDKVALVRSVAHTNSVHERAQHWLMTGHELNVELTDNAFPSIGSITSRMRGSNRAGLPAYASVPKRTNGGNAAYLGVEYNPFSPDSDPNSDGYQVRDLNLPGDLELGRFDRRRNLLTKLDRLRRDVDTRGIAEGYDRFRQQAVEMTTSNAARNAFDIEQEDPRLRDKYGRNTVGQSCLLARRLVEAGVTFVTVATGGWDTHGNNFNLMKDKLLPPYDQAVAALIEDIHDRGLAKNVLVLAWGEFGRTPQINSGAGRDHWPAAQSALFAGGGLKTGQVIGSTDKHAAAPVDRPLAPADILATMYHVLGIDYRREFTDNDGRPIPILGSGAPITELI